MNPRHRREQSGFDLQTDAVSQNGKQPSARKKTAASEPGEGDATSTDGTPTTSSQGAVGLKVAQSGAAGKIEVSPRAIAHLASRATQRSYGVVGLASRHARPGWVELLRREE